MEIKKEEEEGNFAYNSLWLKILAKIRELEKRKMERIIKNLEFLSAYTLILSQYSHSI